MSIENPLNNTPKPEDVLVKIDKEENPLDTKIDVQPGIDKGKTETEKLKTLSEIDFKYNKISEKIKKWIKISAVIGVSFVAPKIIHDVEKEIHYRNYVEASLDSEDKQKLEVLKKEIQTLVGENEWYKIRAADREAYFERQETTENKKPKLIGFESIGVNSDIVETLLSEKVFPKNWLNGEIDEIIFDSENNGSDKSGATEGQFERNSTHITFFKKNLEAKVNPSEIIEFTKYLLGHESGHANDWKADKQSNILERAELLDNVLKRLSSEDKYQTPSAVARVDREYYESKGDIYQKATEYWAEICKTYFEFPEFLKQEHPKDFNLVNNFVLKQDSSFNVIEKAGPYFDDKGNPNDKLKNLLK